MREDPAQKPTETRVRQHGSGRPRPASDSPAPATTATPPAYVVEILERPQTPETTVILAEALARWAERNPSAALEWTRASERGDILDLQDHVISTWAVRDALSVADWLDQNPGAKDERNLLALLGIWMDTDQSAAIRWSGTRLETIQRESILTPLLVMSSSRAHSIELLAGVDKVVADKALADASASVVYDRPAEARRLVSMIKDPRLSVVATNQLEAAIAGAPPGLILGLPDPDPEPGNEMDEEAPELPEP